MTASRLALLSPRLAASARALARGTAFALCILAASRASGAIAAPGMPAEGEGAMSRPSVQSQMQLQGAQDLPAAEANAPDPVAPAGPSAPDAPDAPLAVASETNAVPAFVDNSSVLRPVTFGSTAFPDGAVVREVEVELDFAKIDDGPGFCGPPPITGGTDPFNDELFYRLTSPQGTTIDLITAGTYSPSGYGGRVLVTLDDAAAGPPSGVPTTGTFDPAQPLATFDGQNPEGTWNLTVGDTTAADPLCHYAYTLTVEATVPVADLRVSKFVEPVGTILAGDLFTYTIFVDNLGPDIAQNVVITDTLLNSGEVTIQSCAFSVSQGGGAITQFTCTTGDVVSTQFGTNIGTFSTNLLEPLSPDSQGRLRASFRLIANRNIDVTNETRATSDTFDPNMENNFATVDLTVLEEADLRVTKFSEPHDRVAVGEIFTYTIYVDNLGPSVARNVVISDTLLQSGRVQIQSCAFSVSQGGGAITQFTCTTGPVVSTQFGSDIGTFATNFLEPLTPDSQGRLRASFRLLALRTIDITNTTRVTSDTPDPDMSNNLAVDQITVYEEADLSILKLVEPFTSVRAGEIFTYTILVDNWGPTLARNVAITDTLLSSGNVSIQSCAFSVSQGGGAITQFTCTTGPLVSTQFGTDIGTFRTNFLETRTGSSQGRLRASFRLVANQDIELQNVATVASDTFDPDISNNTAIVSLTVDAVSDIQAFSVFGAEVQTAGLPGRIIDTNVLPPMPDPVCCNFGGTTVTSGRRIQWDTTIINAGPSRAENPRIEVLLPYGTQLIENTLTGLPNPGGVPGRCMTEPAGEIRNKVICLYPTMDAGDSASLRFQVRVDDSVPPGTQLSFDAIATADGIDPNTSNNITSIQFDNNTWADMSISKAAVGRNVIGFDSDGRPIHRDIPNSVTSGEELRYEITVQNNGPSDASNVQVLDVLPDLFPGSPHLAATFIRSERAVCYPSDEFFPGTVGVSTGQQIVCYVGDVPAGARRTFDIYVLIDPSIPQGTVLDNAAMVLFGPSSPPTQPPPLIPGVPQIPPVLPVTNDPFTANNIATNATTVNAVTNPTVGKTDSPDPVLAGNEVDFTITFRNPGPSTMTNTRVEDTLPLGFVFDRCESLDLNDQVTCQVISGDGDTTPQVVRLIEIREANVVVYSDGGTMDPGEEFSFRLVADVQSGYVLDGRGDTGPGEACEPFFLATGYQHYGHDRVVFSSDQATVTDDECTRVDSEADLQIDVEVGVATVVNVLSVPPGGASADTAGASPDGPILPVLPQQIECPDVSPGQAVAWDVTVTNLGPSDAADVLVTIQLPPGVVHDPSQVTVDVTGDLVDTPPFIEILDTGVITVQICRLNAGGVVNIHVETTARLDATGTQVLTAEVETVVDDRCPDRTGRPTLDPKLDNNVDSAGINILISTLRVRKTVSFDGTCPGLGGRVTARPGQDATFCLEITNTGNTFLDRIDVIDTIDTRLGSRVIFTDTITSGGDLLVPLGPGETVTRTYAIDPLLGEECGIATNNVVVTGIPTNAGRTVFECVLLATDSDSVRVDVPCAGVDFRIQLPVLDNDECETWIQVQNVGNLDTKAIMVIWGEPGFCPPQAAGPLKVECSGLLRPGSAWSFAPAMIPVGAKSAILYSINATDRVADERGNRIPFADLVCGTLFDFIVGDHDEWLRFDEAYKNHGVYFGPRLPSGHMVTLDFGAHQGQPLAATVNRMCPDPTDPNVTVNAAYTGVSSDEEGARDPIFGGFTYYAPLVLANQNGLNSWIWIQNSGIECTSLEIWLKAQDNCLRAILGDVLSLAPGETVHFDPNTVVGPDWQGSAWIRGSQPLGVIVDTMGANHFTSYKGVTGDIHSLQFSLGTQVNYAPLIYNQQQGWDTAIQVQNLSSTTNAKVKVYFLDQGGGIVQTLVDWICPRGSQTFFLPVIGGLPGNWVGSARVESQEWWSPGDPIVDPPRIQSIVMLEKWDDPARTIRREAVAYNAFTERTALDWQLGRGDGTDGAAVLAIPFLAKENRGITSEIAITNLVPKPGFTDFVLFLYDQNGLVDRVCEKLNEKQVEYIDLSTWGFINPRWLGSGVISATFWEHDVFDGQGNFVRNYVGLGAVAVERVGGTRAGGDLPGDESKAFEAFPVFGFFLNEGPVNCPGVP